MQGLGRRPGKIYKEHATRMTKLPSTLVIHKRTDGADSRFAAIDNRLSDTPLQKWLGVLRHGSYRQAPDDADWAFVSLQDMWADELEQGADEHEDDAPLIEVDPPPDPDLDDADDQSEGGEQATDEERVGYQQGPPTRPVEPPDVRALCKFYRTIQDSPTKLFFIRWPIPEAAATWKLGQVDLDETDPQLARTQGVYFIRWWTPLHAHTYERKLTECEWVPDIRRCTGTDELG
jgi:hypothetical protein